MSDDVHGKWQALVRGELPTAPHFNVQLDTIPAYVSGMVRTDGRPVVVWKLGETWHSVYAEHAIQFAEFMIEQAKGATALADGIKNLRKLADKVRAEVAAAQPPLPGTDKP